MLTVLIILIYSCIIIRLELHWAIELLLVVVVGLVWWLCLYKSNQDRRKPFTHKVPPVEKEV